MWRPLFFVVTAIVVMAAGLFGWVRLQHGFSARDEPSGFERVLARTLRRVAVPSDARSAHNPSAVSQEIVAEGLAHFADHCASCHANNGSGDTPLGRGMYPRTPDMRRPDTQDLTDGELYWVVHNGIRLSGMPAWGDADHDEDTWKLVAFIRHLPSLTSEEEAAMERLNPRSPDEILEEQEDRQFLAGENGPSGIRKPSGSPATRP